MCIQLFNAIIQKAEIVVPNATKNVETTDKRLVNAVDVYESSFAPLVKIFLHRYVDSDATCATIANGNMFLAIDSSKYAVSYLRKPFIRELARTGDSKKGEVVGKEEGSTESTSNG